MKMIYNDGGRSSAGFKGDAGDCVVRAIAIAAGLPYQKVYSDLKYHNERYAETSRTRVARSLKKKGTTPRNGNYRDVYHSYILSLGFEWIPTMQIGSGCQVHLNEKELPSEVIIARLSKHLTTVIDGVVHDTAVDDRNGTRCVYGYYRKAR